MNTVLLFALANYAILELWFHGSIFEGLRARVDAETGWAGRLLRCPLCLSFWTALTLVVVFLLDAQGGKALIPVTLSIVAGTIVFGVLTGRMTKMRWKDDVYAPTEN